MSNQTNFAERLKKLREDKELTPFDLSQKCGIREQNIRLYEKGRTPHSLSVYKKIAKPLGTTPEYLAFGTQSTESVA